MVAEDEPETRAFPVILAFLEFAGAVSRARLRRVLDAGASDAAR
jgi:hypothetical protein